MGKHVWAFCSAGDTNQVAASEPVQENTKCHA